MGSRNLLDASGYGQQLICELTVTPYFCLPSRQICQL